MEGKAGRRLYEEAVANPTLIREGSTTALPDIPRCAATEYTSLTMQLPFHAIVGNHVGIACSKGRKRFCKPFAITGKETKTPPQK